MDRLRLLVNNVLGNQPDTFVQFQKDYEKLNDTILKGTREIRNQILDIIQSLFEEGIVRQRDLDLYTEFINSVSIRKKTKMPDVHYEKSIQSDLITFEGLNNPWQTYEDKEDAKEKLDHDMLRAMNSACAATKIGLVLQRKVKEAYGEVFSVRLWKSEYRGESIFKDLMSAEKAAVIVKAIEKFEYQRFKILNFAFKTYKSRALHPKHLKNNALQSKLKLSAAFQIFQTLSSITSNRSTDNLSLILSFNLLHHSQGQVLTYRSFQASKLHFIFQQKSKSLLYSSFLKLLRNSHHKEVHQTRSLFYIQGYQAYRKEILALFFLLICLTAILVFYLQEKYPVSVTSHFSCGIPTFP
jgi:hypothetical protein